MGRAQYHTHMLLSVILYAYIQGVYSGRQIQNMLIDSIRIRYEEQLVIMGVCNSFLKTKHDATFMRMNEDYMLNSQQNQVIIFNWRQKINLLLLMIVIQIQQTHEQLSHFLKRLNQK